MDYVLNFLAYIGTSMGMLMLGTLLFALSTPKINEFKLIVQGNVAAALLLGGKVIGLALVLGAAAEYSLSLWDMVVWGAIGIVAQIVLFTVVEIATIRFSLQKAIADDNRAAGAMLLMLSIAVGWIIAKSLSY